MSEFSAAAGPAPELVAFVESHVGQITKASDFSWSHGESEVWRVTTEECRAALKVHRQGRKFEGELAAYNQWLPALRPKLEPGTALPRLLAAKTRHPRALLLSWEEGAVLEAVHVQPEAEVALHERAGRFLRALHALETVDEDPLPLERAFELRLEAWGRRAAGHFEAGVAEAVLSEAERALPFVASCERVPCHRDFTPRNWLTQVTAAPPDGETSSAAERHSLAIIDFEHSRPDLYLWDLQRLYVGAWRQRPDLKRAFLVGYGRSLSATEDEALRRISALWGLSTVVWAREHADSEFEAVGWEVLRWLGLL